MPTLWIMQAGHHNDNDAKHECMYTLCVNNSLRYYFSQLNNEKKSNCPGEKLHSSLQLELDNWTRCFLTMIMLIMVISTARCSSVPSCLRYIHPTIPSHTHVALTVLNHSIVI